MHKIPFLIFSWRLLLLDMIFAIWLSQLKYASFNCMPAFFPALSHFIVRPLRLFLLHFPRGICHYWAIFTSFLLLLYVHSFPLIIFAYRCHFFGCGAYCFLFPSSSSTPHSFGCKISFFFLFVAPMFNFSLGFCFVCLNTRSSAHNKWMRKKAPDIHKFNFSEIVIIIVV